ncbi:type I-E CRISPR-associated protein Cas5/CasD [Bifidobacterium rousetti]|uniref:type I-E CRISPR-associated protein Cas5/CasD n=1 Tax=Bifidobacterium rousetti TaxID=2045439 RepID=UPI00123C2BB7|nr:type I-E CRISPR-associated protein Cas5/CasD [Bifidobacterium rousetti]KAA8819411.1 type I-E CRISPR-associated protein Cas5/CasD [Bifidobacterium rousetti]
MPVLLMRLAAPMQSWGSSSRFTRRETEMCPTKSGVIGMVAAALGVKRDESLERFMGLRFGVRIDQPGTLMSDFQTARMDNGDMLPLSRRYYLQDAVFLVALESADGEELESYRQALAAPYYQLFLGRRSCPPDGPIQTWLTDEGLEDALRHAPWRASERYQRSVLRRGGLGNLRMLSIVVEPTVEEGTANGFVDELRDQPVSFDPRRRDWTLRRYMRLGGGIPPQPTVHIDVADGEPSGPSGSSEERESGEVRNTAFDDDMFFETVSGVDTGADTEEL